MSWAHGFSDCPEGGGEEGGEGGTVHTAALSQAQQLQVAAHPLLPSSPRWGEANIFIMNVSNVHIWVGEGGEVSK